jgi:ATP phosphoribosyltransferase regulatory subunit
VVDLGETREFYYYTGVMFHLLAEGPGEPLGSGGRYDSLFERFDLPCPAAGFAFDISNVCWALDERGVQEARLDRVLVTAAAASEQVVAVLRELRERGIACASGPEPKALDAYVTRWDYTFVLELGPKGGLLRRTDSESKVAVAGKDAAEIAQVVATHLRVLEEV